LTNTPNTVFSGQLHTRYRQNILASHHIQLKCMELKLNENPVVWVTKTSAKNRRS